MSIYKKCMKERLTVLNAHQDNIFNPKCQLQSMEEGKFGKTWIPNRLHKIKCKKFNIRMLDHKSHQWIEMEINQEEVNKKAINPKPKFKNNLYLKIIPVSKRTKMINRLWTITKQTWSINLLEMSKNKSNNWCRDKIFLIN